MLEIPEEVKNLFRKDNISKPTEKKIRLYFYEDQVETLYPYETLFPSENLFPEEHAGDPWVLIENDRIESESLSISESLSESENLEFGSCESASMEIIVADVIDDLTDKEFTMTVEIDGYEMSMGIYTVESFMRQADRRKRKITAYDRMRKFDTDVSDWYNRLDFPITLKNLRDSLCAYIGVPQEEKELVFDSMSIEKTIDPKEISGLDVLKAICQINGCFGHINKTGKLIYKTLQFSALYPSEDLFPDEGLYPSEFGGDGESVEFISHYKQGATYEDYLVEGITGLSIRQEENDIGANVGNGYNSYAIEGNFLVYGKSAIELLNIAQVLLAIIKDRVYRPAIVECNAMPWVEVGDAVRVVTRDDIIETFVMKRTIRGCQAMTDTIEATGSQKQEEVFGINKQIIQLEGKAAVIIKTVDEVSVRLTDLKAQEEAHFEVTTKAITAEVKRASEAEAAIKIQADNISLDVKNFKENTQSQFQLTDQKISAKVSKGDVSSELSLEPGKVTLSSNRLIVDSTNFKLDGNGNAKFSGKLESAGGKFVGEVDIHSETITDNYPIVIRYWLTNTNVHQTAIGPSGYLITMSEGSNATYMKLNSLSDEGTPELEGGTFKPMGETSLNLNGKNRQLRISADGVLKAEYVRNHSNNNEANVYISSNGYFYHSSSSSRRYKKDESTDLGDIEPEKLYNLPVKTFRYVDGYLQERIDGKILGFIAEDMDEIFPWAVQYENGIPETWNSRIIIPAMLKLIQGQNERLKEVEKKYENTYI